MLRFIIAIIAVGAGLFLMTPGAMAAADNQDKSGDGELVCAGSVSILSFFTAGDTYVYNLHALSGGTLKVLTADCCLAGDIWRATVSLRGANKAGSTKAGNGALSPNFSGQISKGLTNGKDYVLIVSIDNVSALFPADMYLCIQGPVSVTPL